MERSNLKIRKEGTIGKTLNTNTQQRDNKQKQQYKQPGQYEPPQKVGLTSGAPEGYACPALRTTPVILS